MSASEPLEASEVVNRLRDRYPSAAYAFFEQVRNGTGYSRTVVRTADALAFSLWPSRGLTLDGFEIKAYRGDYWQGAASLSELAQSGTSRPKQCKFPEPVDRIMVLEAIEILDVTPKAAATIDAVPVWKA